MGRLCPCGLLHVTCEGCRAASLALAQLFLQPCLLCIPACHQTTFAIFGMCQPACRYRCCLLVCKDELMASASVQAPFHSKHKWKAHILAQDASHAHTGSHRLRRWLMQGCQCRISQLIRITQHFSSSIHRRPSPQLCSEPGLLHSLFCFIPHDLPQVLVVPREGGCQTLCQALIPTQLRPPLNQASPH